MPKNTSPAQIKISIKNLLSKNFKYAAVFGGIVLVSIPILNDSASLIDMVYGWFSSHKDKNFYQSEIIKELNKSRNLLDNMIAEHLNDKTYVRIDYELENKDKIDIAFKDSPEIYSDVKSAYKKLSSAKTSAIKIPELLANERLNRINIENKYADIERTIVYVDSVGKKLSSITMMEWRIPPQDATAMDRIQFYKSKPHIIYTVSTDQEVSFMGEGSITTKPEGFSADLDVGIKPYKDKAKNNSK